LISVSFSDFDLPQPAIRSSGVLENGLRGAVTHAHPPGVLRVGKSRVLLELVIQAHQQGTSPEAIVEMYDTLDLADVFAVIAYYLAHRAEVEDYLRKSEQEAEAIKRQIEASQPARPGLKEELSARARAKGLKT
jgi:uncharacterized protein (DUF433 family)